MPEIINGIPYQVDNPSDEDRYTMLKFQLSQEERPEDFNNIIELMSPPPDVLSVCSKGSGKGLKVAVIGAGEAGLSAAFELRKTGCSITVFEATNRIGGRVYTRYFDRDKKYYAELGPMRIPVSNQSTWHYINLFKIKTSPFASKNNRGFYYIRNGRAVNDAEGISVMKNIYPRFNLAPEERPVPWQKLYGRILKKYLNGLSPEIRKELNEIKLDYSPIIKSMDRMNVRMAYEDVGLSQDAISMLGFLSANDAAFFPLGLLEYLQDAYAASFSYLYRIDEGMIRLPEMLYKSLKDEVANVYGNVGTNELGNVNFRFDTAVDGIYETIKSDKKCITLKCRDRADKRIYYEDFDYVVCSMPFSSLRRVDIKPPFTVMKMQAIAEHNYISAQKTALFLSDRFWEGGEFFKPIIGGRSTTDMPSITTYYPSDHAEPVPGAFEEWRRKAGTSHNEPGVLLASYNLGMDAERLGHENPGLRIWDIIRYNEEIHGLPRGYIEKRVIDYASLNWSDMQYIFGGLALSKPEDKTLFSYEIAQPEMNEKVFFAGEHVSQRHGWQQGAFQTGMLAALEIAKRIGEAGK